MLPDNTCKIDNWVFIGSPWYDYSLVPEHPFTTDDFIKYERAGRRWMDNINCKWKDFIDPNRDFELTNYFYKQLETQLAKNYFK